MADHGFEPPQLLSFNKDTGIYSPPLSKPHKLTQFYSGRAMELDDFVGVLLLCFIVGVVHETNKQTNSLLQRSDNNMLHMSKK